MHLPAEEGSAVAFIVGRPGAGKSTVVSGLQARFQRAFPADFPVRVTDEFDILRSLSWSKAFANVRRTAEGGIEILDGESVFAATMEELEKRIVALKGHRGVTLCEFARGSYAPVFSGFDAATVDSACVIYVRTPLDLCCQRVEARRFADVERYVPQSTLRRHYANDAADELARIFGARLYIIDNGSGEADELHRRAFDFLCAQLKNAALART